MSVALAVAATWFLTTTAFSATYHVSLSGNDTQAGTLSQPWRTIAKANNTLRAGDTVPSMGAIWKIP